MAIMNSCNEAFVCDALGRRVTVRTCNPDHAQWQSIVVLYGDRRQAG